MARRLAAGASDIPGISLAYPVEANGVFAVLPSAVTVAVQREFPFYVWDESTGVVRWMASFDTTEQDVDDFVALVTQTMGEYRE
jgi:threonine aldolase